MNKFLEKNQLLSKALQIFRQSGFVLFILISIDFTLYLISSFLRDKFYRWTNDDFRLKEALFWPKDVLKFLRYSKVTKELKNEISTNAERKISVLEIGSGGIGISHLLKYASLKKKCDLTLADVDANFLRKVKSDKTVLIQGDSLPLEDNTFDVIISLDTLEHIPKDKRPNFLSEIKRVAKKTVLLHFVVYDPPEQFLSKDADQKFQEWYTKKFHRPDRWTDEHLTIGPPTIREIKDILPGVLITGTQNINTWFNYMTLCERPIIGFFAGIMYLIKWKKKDNSPPFHSCFVKWNKPSSE